MNLRQQSCLCIILFFTFSLTGQITRTQLSVVGSTKMLQLSSGEIVVSGYNVIEPVELNPIRLNPTLELIDKSGNFIDSTSFAQFTKLAVINELENGDIMLIGTKDDNLTLASVSSDLTTITKESPLADPTDALQPSELLKIGNHFGTPYIDFIAISSNQETSRYWMFLSDDEDLKADSIWILSSTIGDFYSNRTGELFQVENNSTGSTLTRYEFSFPLWSQQYPYEILDLHPSDNGFIYIAGSKMADFPGEQDALLAQLGFDGTVITERCISVHGTPDFWPDYNLSFSKIVATNISIKVFGIENYHTWGSASGHFLLSGDYNYNLGNRSLDRESEGTPIASFVDLNGNSDYVQGIVNAEGLHQDRSYFFQLSNSEPLSTIEITETPTLVYPNPVQDKLHLDLPIGTKINITALNGQLVFKGNYTDEIQVKDWQQGIYFIKAEQNNGFLMSRFVKL